MAHGSGEPHPARRNHLRYIVPRRPTNPRLVLPFRRKDIAPEDSALAAENSRAVSFVRDAKPLLENMTGPEAEGLRAHCRSHIDSLAP